jgi:enediyne biosynthesis protein E4
MDISQVSAARGHFWMMDVPGHYVDFSHTACCSEMATARDHSFTASFAAIDNDGVPDLFWARDFGTSGLFSGLGDGSFSGPGSVGGIPSDENGMGMAVGDFDNDGRLDWFVTSIFDPTPASPEDPDGNWGRTGNRLYRLGDDGWEDTSISAGVRDGGWGWGACARDFDLDGDLDLFHVNGFFGAMATEFHADAARLFVNDGAAHFSEQAAQRGIADTGQGRAVVCADLDSDGDIDVFVQNSGSDVLGSSRLFLNNAAVAGHGISITLRQAGMNPDAVGARVHLRRSDGLTQMRELEAGGNFLGMHPIGAHFGLGANDITAIQVRWPAGTGSPDSLVEHFRPFAAAGVTLTRGTGFDLFIDAFE